jgi:hypothetical protein
MAGVHAEIRSRFAQSAHKYIVASRISQGNDAFKNSSAEERHDIETRWLAQKDKLKGFLALKQKEKGKSRDISPSSTERPSPSLEQTEDAPRTGWFQNSNLTPDEKKKLAEQRKRWKRQRAGGPFVEENIPLGLMNRDSGDVDREFEAAIQAAVQETSRGDTVEDARIEQAIRSSVRIMRTRSVTMSSLASSTSNTPSAYSQSGWVPDVKRPIPNTTPEFPFSPDDLENITDEEYQALIEEAIKLSIAESQQQAIRMEDLEQEGDGEEEQLRLALEKSQSESLPRDDYDQEYQKALAASQTEHELQKQNENNRTDFDEEALRQAIEASQAEQGNCQDDEDEELRRAMQESEKAHQEELARMNSMKSEEDIVMEYVKRQSLAEAAFHNAKKAEAAGTGEDEDEELRRALEESVKTDDGIRRGGGGGPSRA